MLKKENFLIIGSTGRNTGKTEFACNLIKKYANDNYIIGVKIVAIIKKEGNCPRGGKGCGVCTSLKGEYEITEETFIDLNKDTSRMLVAGANKVYLLKVDKNFLKEGLQALIKKIPEKALVIIESNSIRKVLEPALFIVIKNMEDNTIKSSCAEVIHYANKVIEFNKMSWNFSPDRVISINNTWIIKEKATAIILAGGKSSRMKGVDKSMLPINGIPLIQSIVNQLKNHFDEIIIGANDIEKYKFLNLPIVADIDKDKGPLMGILSCLKASNNEVNFITACDIPIMDIKLIKNMINLSSDVDIVMPVKNKEEHEPLYAVYKKNIVNFAEMILNNNGRRIIELFKYTTVKFVAFNDNQWYQNLNYKKEYLDFVKLNADKQCDKIN